MANTYNYFTNENNDNNNTNTRASIDYVSSDVVNYATNYGKHAVSTTISTSAIATTT
jgi:hypothetical protein